MGQTMQTIPASVCGCVGLTNHRVQSILTPIKTQDFCFIINFMMDKNLLNDSKD